MIFTEDTVNKPAVSRNEQMRRIRNLKFGIDYHC